jgi:hypothetical protein
VAAPARRRRQLGRAAALLGLLACLVPATATALPADRGWELVSPVEKNGGVVAAAGTIAGGGVLQAAADGNSVTYGSAASFSPGAQGAPTGSQYLSGRGGGGWATANLTVPLFSGSFGAEPVGVPYQLFSPDLFRALLLSGRPCRSEEAACPIANPSLPGTDAPVGFQNYYLRQGGAFAALLGGADVAATTIAPADFAVRLAGASASLDRVVLESCAALTATATEVPLGESCDPDQQNLYEWSAASGNLTLVNASPGAELGAQAGAVSDGAQRIYFNGADGSLYLREGAQIKLVYASAAEAPEFQTASGDGAVAYFSIAGTLFRYLADAETATPLTDPLTLTGVLGASANGSHVYYQTTSGLYLWHAGTTTKVPAASVPADSVNYPPTTGTARVDSDGSGLVFLSKSPLTGYNNLDQTTGLPDFEVFLYESPANVLRCVSCRSNGTRPVGPSTIPGSGPNGSGEGVTDSYKPRALSADGRRVFFDSEDALVAVDTNKEPDVYQWEAQGSGACVKAGGCVELISSGRSEEGARFADASGDGDDAFFTTDASLVGADPGAVDLYDARVGGGFPEPPAPFTCNGDSCQNLPSEPPSPALNTLVSGLGNPKVHYFKYQRQAKKHKAKKHRKAKHGKGAKRGAKGGRR